MAGDLGLDLPNDLAAFIGNHFIYTHANGWRYEWYARNATTCDYRIHRAWSTDGG